MGTPGAGEGSTNQRHITPSTVSNGTGNNTTLHTTEVGGQAASTPRNLKRVLQLALHVHPELSIAAVIAGKTTTPGQSGRELKWQKMPPTI
jgi:hypothetical protein